MLTHNNHVQLTGRVGQRPELHFLTDGTPVARLRLYLGVPPIPGAYDRTDQSFRIVAWGEVARQLCLRATKGNRVTVRGHLRNRSFQRDGQTHVRTEIHADYFQHIGNPAVPSKIVLTSETVNPS
ncbi:single-stranded DNA-binding protein [Neolewinella antarctica]|uniref:Plasmid-derived single-stranded DNA-binding protein n=1 Tax=Neolewinella antarctica TaxID=442734 RepID=A0ABX0X8N4_9BACT|nr:single-stranded DNA-binding protein [Neolewinella antarctica]NJC25203.1 single-stranded DNA-binding protein [Neolewinella antarctica]